MHLLCRAGADSRRCSRLKPQVSESMVGTRHAVSDNNSKADSACRVPTSPNVSKVNGKRKGENGTDAGSESRSKIYFDYAEQQGGKDREAGLKRGNCATLQNKFLARSTEVWGTG